MKFSEDSILLIGLALFAVVIMTIIMQTYGLLEEGDKEQQAIRDDVWNRSVKLVGLNCK